MKPHRTILVFITGLLLFGAQVVAAELSLAVDVAHPAHSISPRLYGIFFEDINFGGDGGLNAELVKNDSFEFPQPLTGWSIVGEADTNGDVRITNSGLVILKVVNPASEEANVDLSLEGVAVVDSPVRANVLQGNPGDENSISEPQNVAPSTHTLDITGPRFGHAFAPYSLSVLRFDVKAN